jgi:hypothetical protein
MLGENRGIDWIDACVEEGRMKKVHTFFQGAKDHESRIAQFEVTPQSPPYHAEGPFLQAHIERMVAALYTIQEGGSLLEIEELAARKDLKDHIEGLEHTMREHAGTLLAYCVLHDLAKPVTSTLVAPNASAGAHIGFQTQKKMPTDKARSQDHQLYAKYVQHLSIEQGLNTPKELTAAFYDRYEVRVHYPKHGKIGGAAEYRDAHLAIGQWLRLREQDIDLLGWLIRHHIDAISGFEKEASVNQYEILAGRAQRDGFDVQEALDLLLAAVFLDACIGSLRYREGVFSTDFKILFHFLEAEIHIAPHRRKERARKAGEKKQKAFKALLERFDLIGSAVFSLFDIPFGPERGALMHEIHAFVRGELAELSPQYTSEELAFRLKQARAAFDAE